MSKLRDREKRQAAKPPAKSARKRRRTLKWISRIVSLLAVGLIVAHWFWGRSSTRALKAQIHTYQIAGEPIDPADLNDPPIPDPDNAAIDLRKAGQSLDTSAREWLIFSRLDLKLPLSAKQLEAIDNVLDQNHAALESIQAMANKPAANWQTKFSSPLLDVKYEEPLHVLDLSTLLRAAALYAHQQGAEAESLRRIKEMLALARVVDRDRKLSAHLTAASIATLAAKTAAEISPDLNVPSPSLALLNDLIAQFLDDGPLRQGQIRALELTRAMFWDTSRQVASGRADLLSRAQGSRIAGGRVGCYALRPMIMDDGLWLVQYMSKMIAAAKFSADWPEFCQNLPPIPRELVQNPRAHLMARSLLPDFSQYLLGQYRAMTECRIAAVALAAGAYAQNHRGAMPASLTELTPTYLPYVPFDPMAGGGKPLHWAGTAEQRIIYSAGDDGVDDGGSEVSPAPAYGAPTGPWDRRDFVIRLEKRPALKAATTQTSG